MLQSLAIVLEAQEHEITSQLSHLPPFVLLFTSHLPCYDFIYLSSPLHVTINVYSSPCPSLRLQHIQSNVSLIVVITQTLTPISLYILYSPPSPLYTQFSYGFTWRRSRVPDKTFGKVKSFLGTASTSSLLCKCIQHPCLISISRPAQQLPIMLIFLSFPINEQARSFFSRNPVNLHCFAELMIPNAPSVMLLSIRA